MARGRRQVKVERDGRKIKVRRRTELRTDREYVDEVNRHVNAIQAGIDEWNRQNPDNPARLTAFLDKDQADHIVADTVLTNTDPDTKGSGALGEQSERNPWSPIEEALHSPAIQDSQLGGTLHPVNKRPI